MLEICQRYAKICLWYVKDLPKISTDMPYYVYDRTEDWDMPDIYPRYVRDIPEIYQGYAWGLPKILLISAWDMPEIYLKCALDKSEISL